MEPRESTEAEDQEAMSASCTTVVTGFNSWEGAVTLDIAHLSSGVTYVSGVGEAQNTAPWVFDAIVPAEDVLLEYLEAMRDES
jgi:hypothetical protein